MLLTKNRWNFFFVSPFKKEKLMFKLKCESIELKRQTQLT